MTNLTNGTGDTSRPASGLNVVAGIWLIISAWVVGFAGQPLATWETLCVGIAVLVLAIIRLGTPGAVGLSWINFLLGIWLIIAPFVLGFSESVAATRNSVVLGILVGVFGLWGAIGEQRQTPVAPRGSP